jgi:hypothetical protein
MKAHQNRSGLGPSKYINSFGQNCVKYANAKKIDLTLFGAGRLAK